MRKVQPRPLTKSYEFDYTLPDASFSAQQFLLAWYRSDSSQTDES